MALVSCVALIILLPLAVPALSPASSQYTGHLSSLFIERRQSETAQMQSSGSTYTQMREGNSAARYRRSSGSGSGSGSGTPTAAPTVGSQITLEVEVSFSAELTVALQEASKTTYKSQLETWYQSLLLEFEVTMEQVSSRRSYSYALSGTAGIVASAAELASTISVAAPSPGAKSLSTSISHALASAMVSEGITNSVGTITVSQTTFSPTAAPTSGATAYEADSERLTVTLILFIVAGALACILVAIGCACHSNNALHVPSVNFTDDTARVIYGNKYDPNSVEFDPNCYKSDPNQVGMNGLNWVRNPASGVLMTGRTNVVTGEMKAIGSTQQLQLGSVGVTPV